MWKSIIANPPSCAVNWHFRTIPRMKYSLLPTLDFSLFRRACACVRYQVFIFTKKRKREKQWNKKRLHLPSLVLGVRKKSRDWRGQEQEATNIINLTTTSYKLLLQCRTKANSIEHYQKIKALLLFIFSVVSVGSFMAVNLEWQQKEKESRKKHERNILFG